MARPSWRWIAAAVVLLLLIVVVWVILLGVVWTVFTNTGVPPEIEGP